MSRKKYKNKIIAVDVDDTYVELVNKWLRLYNEDWGDNLKKEDITDWCIGTFTKCNDVFYEYLNYKDLYKSIRLVKGAYRVVNRIRNAGARVIFVTASNHPDKLDFLMRNNAISNKKDYFVAHDKSLIRADVLIDDNYENIKTFPKDGILLDKPWNRKYNDVRRAMNWDEVEKILFKNKRRK